MIAAGRLGEEDARACEAGLALLARKLEQIERRSEDLRRKRAAVLARMAQFRSSISRQTGEELKSPDAVETP